MHPPRVSIRPPDVDAFSMSMCLSEWAVKGFGLLSLCFLVLVLVLLALVVLPMDASSTCGWVSIRHFFLRSLFLLLYLSLVLPSTFHLLSLPAHDTLWHFTLILATTVLSWRSSLLQCMLLSFSFSYTHRVSSSLSHPSFPLTQLRTQASKH